MSLLAATLLGLLGLAATVWFWRGAPRDLEVDASGVPPFTGHLGRCAVWMATADLRPPRPPASGIGDPNNPADRVLAAMMALHQSDAAVDIRVAYAHLKAKRKGGVAAEFVRGRMSVATRAAARQHFRGPQSLFLPWYWLVYRIRHGPRGIHLETLYQALEETRP